MTLEMVICCPTKNPCGVLVVMVGLTVLVTFVMLAPTKVSCNDPVPFTPLVLTLTCCVFDGPNACGSAMFRMPSLIVVLPPYWFCIEQRQAAHAPFEEVAHRPAVADNAGDGEGRIGDLVVIRTDGEVHAAGGGRTYRR